MMPGPILPEAWFARGWGYRLLPHYRWAEDGLETLGGRRVPLSIGERSVAERCRRQVWRPSRGLGGDRLAAVRALIARRILLPIPLPRPWPRGPVSLVLSPHIDDAALSLGAAIAAGTEPVLVLNLFSRQSYQTGLRVPAGLIDMVAQAEDRLAGHILGYRSVFAGLLGAQDRHGLPLSAVIGCDDEDAAVAERVRRDACQLCADIETGLQALASSHRIRRLFAPLGIGGHLDHLVVRSATGAIASRLGVPQCDVHLYRDQPYAAFLAPPSPLPPKAAGGAAPARKHAALLAFATRLRQREIDLTMASAPSTGGEPCCAFDAQAALVASLAACSLR